MKLSFGKLSVILLEGMLVTLEIFFLTLIISIPIGVLVAIMKMSKHKIIRYPTAFYISIMRGTPLILQIIFIYFAPSLILQAVAPHLLGNLHYDRFTAVIIAFSINYAAYFAEIFRGGIQSISKGQYEAAEALGMTKTQTFFRIILPQVIKRVMPACGNEVITLVKDTSLAQVIGVTEMFSLAQKHTSGQSSIVPLFVAGLFYFVFNWLVTYIFDFAEKKLQYYN